MLLQLLRGFSQDVDLDGADGYRKARTQLPEPFLVLHIPGWQHCTHCLQTDRVLLQSAVDGIPGPFTTSRATLIDTRPKEALTPECTEAFSGARQPLTAPATWRLVGSYNTSRTLTIPHTVVIIGTYSAHYPFYDNSWTFLQTAASQAYPMERDFACELYRALEAAAKHSGVVQSQEPVCLYRRFPGASYSELKRDHPPFWPTNTGLN